MRIKKMFLAVCIIFLLGYSFGCAEDKIDSSTYIEINYKTYSGFLGRNTELDINNKGELEYRETGESVKEPKSITKAISRQEVQGIAKFILDKSFFSFADNYSADNLPDGTTTIVRVTIGNRSKEVSCYEKMPDGFSDIVARLEQAIK